MSTLIRAGLSLGAIAVFAGLPRLASTEAGLAAGRVAVEQLSDSAAGPLKTQIASDLAGGSTLPLLALLAVLAVIWLVPARRAPLAVLLFGLGTAAAPEPADAYFSKYDYGEYIEILPNQSAFMIPESGDTKTTQAQFGSEKFLSESKVAAKRVQIPHTKLPNTGTLSDYYVPAARLIIVDRTPVSREWTTSASRGTSSADQGFRFETADSIGLSTSVVISAFVKEEDAAKFLYWFGTKPSAQDTDEARFASVLYGRSLAEVVDGNVHRTVQAALAREFGRRSTDDAIHQKAEIMASVEKAVIDQFAPMGVTVTTLGFADELSFENAAIQAAIDDTFMANKRAQSAQAQLATLPIQERILDMEIRRSDAQARQTLAGRWNGSASGFLPSWVVIPSDVLGTVRGWFGGGETKPALSAAPAKG
ncbi:hypothetical protein MMSR116_08605 [Methylobacterium mesophilicum SR1.6/6]|uniref:Uncharacterized protein n=1 Tax=Methylobacterium mesophilicum SR1.6/6 TaxID=908290 RepID=A0A6B9FGU6_9HYPH|nr:SPFH domain-containing protein [Methylobacterium mesophilicum]QGY01931.1 hypothetical protein MMSR116_08605 [Methylobacterium mesophilicum SR1.6/6]